MQAGHRRASTTMGNRKEKVDSMGTRERRIDGRNFRGSRQFSGGSDGRNGVGAGRNGYDAAGGTSRCSADAQQQQREQQEMRSVPSYFTPFITFTMNWCGDDSPLLFRSLRGSLFGNPPVFDEYSDMLYFS